MNGMIEKLTKSSMRELALKKELADDNLTFSKITVEQQNYHQIVDMKIMKNG